MYKMQLQHSMKQFYKTVKKDDMRNFSLFTESKAPSFWKANNSHSKQNLHFAPYLKNDKLWDFQHRNVILVQCTLYTTL